MAKDWYFLELLPLDPIRSMGEFPHFTPRRMTLASRCQEGDPALQTNTCQCPADKQKSHSVAQTLGKNQMKSIQQKNTDIQFPAGEESLLPHEIFNYKATTWVQGLSQISSSSHKAQHWGTWRLHSVTWITKPRPLQLQAILNGCSVQRYRACLYPALPATNSLLHTMMDWRSKATLMTCCRKEQETLREWSVSDLLQIKQNWVWTSLLSNYWATCKGNRAVLCVQMR